MAFNLVIEVVEPTVSTDEEKPVTPQPQRTAAGAPYLVRLAPPVTQRLDIQGEKVCPGTPEKKN